MKAIIHRVNLKPEIPEERGLPKHAVKRAEVTFVGLRTDFNRWRKEKASGDPQQAILLMPLEMIEQLNREGWPVQPGDLGENFTTRGLEYHSIQPGQRYKLGKVAEILISKACQPCSNLYLLPYVGGERGPSFLKDLKDRRGWFASVLVEGEVCPGDPIGVTGSGKASV